jgi:hypothetical protein
VPAEIKNRVFAQMDLGWPEFGGRGFWGLAQQGADYREKQCDLDTNDPGNFGVEGVVNPIDLLIER